MFVYGRVGDVPITCFVCAASFIDLFNATPVFTAFSADAPTASAGPNSEPPEATAPTAKAIEPATDRAAVAPWARICSLFALYQAVY